MYWDYFKILLAKEEVSLQFLTLIIVSCFFLQFLFLFLYFLFQKRSTKKEWKKIEKEKERINMKKDDLEKYRDKLSKELVRIRKEEIEFREKNKELILEFDALIFLLKVYDLFELFESYKETMIKLAKEHNLDMRSLDDSKKIIELLEIKR